MSNILSSKNAFLSASLSLVFGPFGYLYLGLNLFVAGIAIFFLILFVLSVLHTPYPSFFNYAQLLVWGYFGYKLANMRNLIAADINLSESDIKEFKSIRFAFYVMLHIMMVIVQFYAVILGLFLTVSAFSQGKYVIAILILLFGISLIIYVFRLIFGLISVGIMKLFKIDKRYF